MNRFQFFLFYIIFFIVSGTYGQAQYINVTYRQYFDTDKPTQRIAYLFANDSISIFEDDLSTSTPWNKGNKKDTDSTTKTLLPDYRFNDYIQIDYKKKNIRFFEELQTNDFYLVIDTYISLPWKLSNETKMIQTFKCFKAQCDFRGRKWTAWYALDLNFPLGPWKLYGLPGLILEAYDETNRYTFSAEKIVFVKNNILDKDFKQLRPQPQKEITIKEFMENKEEYRMNGGDNVTRNSTETVKRQPRRAGMEIIYEWENMVK